MNRRNDPPRLDEVHVTTADGIDIACFVSGEGPDLILLGAPPFVDTRFQWHSKRLMTARIEARLARRRRVIQFDPRGCGASQRNVRDYSLAARVQDLRAVTDRFARAPVPVVAFVNSGPVAIAYASANPGLISRLVLLDTYAYGPDFYEHPQIKAMLALREHDWEFYTETVATGVTGWRGDAYAREMARLFRSATTPETVRRFYDADLLTDVRTLLPALTIPTLVIHSARLPFLPLAIGERLASEIPQARLRVIDSMWGPDNDTETQAAVIDDFLGDLSPEPAPDEPRATIEPSATAIILFADIVDSTALTERMGDAAFRERARALDASLRGIITGAGGTAIDGFLSGDGILATFPSASQAIDASLRCGIAGAGGGLPLHLG
ncbi:MAG: alpha/beta fold hydrolase, partial [Chloroflexota bacterium]|nr:alpha/beta fold hydrolase [Chloroflexota bacterium]